MEKKKLPMPIKVSKSIRLCTGPGCRAWEAEKIGKKLCSMQETLDFHGYHVQQVPCMNRCGGGACLKIAPGSQLIKLRKPKEIIKLMNLRISA